MIILSEEQCVDSYTGVHFNWHDSMIHISGVPHSHEFYEIFMLTEGAITHIVNGKHIPLQEGDLVLIRPHDAHTYEVNNSQRWRLANLTFSCDMLNNLLYYLGIDRHTCSLLTAELPPHVQLPTEAERLAKIQSWEQLAAISGNQKQRFRLFARTLIADMIMHLFLPSIPADSVGETWMDRLLSEMSLSENYIPGIPKLKKLAPYSYEHICRTFRRRLGLSPSEWINEQRLYFAANQLEYTRKPILEIIAEAGFDNPSYFYTLFKKQFAVSPKQYRERMLRTVIP